MNKRKIEKKEYIGTHDKKNMAYEAYQYKCFSTVQHC